MLSRYVMTQDQLQAVGLLALEASLLERNVRSLIQILSGLDGGMLDALMPRAAMLSVKMQMLDKVVRQRTDNADALTAFKKIFEQVGELISKRNTVIHGNWWSNFSLEDLMQEHYKQDAVATGKGNTSVQASEVINLAEGFSNATSALLHFAVDYEKALGVDDMESQLAKKSP